MKISLLKTEIEKHKKEIVGLESNLNYLSEHFKDVEKIWMTKIQHEANDLFKKWADEWQQRFQEDGKAQMM